MTRALILLAISLITLNAFAENTEEDDRLWDIEMERRRAMEIQRIPSIVEQYASTLGCAFYMNPKNVVVTTVKSNESHTTRYGNQSYIVLYTLDLGCSGGNKMYRPYFATLYWGVYNKLYIDTDQSNPNQTAGTGSFVQDIESIYMKNNVLMYMGSYYDPQKDSRVKIEGIFNFENNAWIPK